MIRSTILSLLFAAVLTSSWTASGEEVVVTTLEWPPYTSAQLPKGGATTEVVRQAFDAANMQMQIEILPWKRAISEARDNDRAVAYYPGYHCRHVEGFVASNPIGNGPLGFAENASAPVTWTSVDSIGDQQLKVGTVLGYANTDEFDEKAGTGWIKAIPARDDVTNLRKLLLQRIDMAVIDKLVLSYLLATEASLKDSADELQFNAVPLEDKTLYLCFNDNPAGREMRDRFNAGLARVNVEEIVEQYFAEEF